MNTVTIQVENPSMLSSLKKVLKAMEGVTVVDEKKAKSRKSIDVTQTMGYKEAKADVEAGRVSGPFNTPDELFEHLGL